MKILYIAPLRDFSGYANAARGYVRALSQAGAEIVARPVRYDRADSGTEYVPTDAEKAMLREPLTDIDVVIQHVTPNEMRPVEGKVNIAIVAWETTRIPEYWVRKLNQFNAVFTFCDASVDAFVDSGVTVPVLKVPHTFEMEAYTLDGVDPICSPSEPEFLSSRFVFYNISQFSSKKGIDVLLRSYLAQFHGQQDDVVLILKTYIDMTNRQQEQEKLKAYVGSIKAAMRLEPSQYPPVMLITKTLSDDQIRKIHRTGDCYVCSSRAEGWCIPAFEGLAYGNNLVTTLWGGMGEFAINEQRVDARLLAANVFPVDYSLQPLVGQNHADPDLYTAKDLVAEPSCSSMMKRMQQAFDNRQTTFARDQALDRFDYSVVGPAMLQDIKDIVDNAGDDVPPEPAPVNEPPAPAPVQDKAEVNQ